MSQPGLRQPRQGCEHCGGPLAIPQPRPTPGSAAPPAAADEPVAPAGWPPALREAARRRPGEKPAPGLPATVGLRPAKLRPAHGVAAPAPWPAAA
eukprot:211793-Chlamydomonas_euryale.AAC.1